MPAGPYLALLPNDVQRRLMMVSTLPPGLEDVWSTRSRCAPWPAFGEMPGIDCHALRTVDSKNARSAVSSTRTTNAQAGPSQAVDATAVRLPEAAHFN